jgi:hypothetical protein
MPSPTTRDRIAAGAEGWDNARERGLGRHKTSV